MFIEREQADPDPDLPPIVRDLHFSRTGRVFLKFKMQYSTPELLKKAREEFYIQMPQKVAEWRTSNYNVQEARWPLKHVYWRCVDSDDNSLWGEGETDSLDGAGAIFDFSVGVDPQLLTRFLERIADKKVKFIPRFSYQGRSTVLGSVQSEAELDFSKVTENLLTSEQINGTKPITQQQANDAVTKLTAAIKRSIVLEDASLMPLLKAEDQRLLEHFFTVDTKDFEVNALEPDLQLQLFEYFKPLMISTAKRKMDQKLKTELEEELHEKTAQIERARRELSKFTHNKQDSLSGGYGPFNFGGTHGSTFDKALEKSRATQDGSFDSAHKAIERQVGVTFEQVTNTDEFKPHKIHFYRANKSAAKIKLKELVNVALVLGQDSGYLEGSPVYVSYTVGEFEKRNLVGVPRGNDGFKVGDVKLTLSTVVERGWVVVCPKHNYPHHPNIPPDLRGKPMPDVAAMFPAFAQHSDGTLDVARIGEAKTTQTIVRNDGEKTLSVNGIDNKIKTLLQGPNDLSSKTLNKHGLDETGKNIVHSIFNLAPGYREKFVIQPEGSSVSVTLPPRELRIDPQEVRPSSYSLVLVMKVD